ncbi:hypothetical protein IJG27_00450 [Candidatus Saccharibacteria bacterium]|nr:hypothetical protein [Candidatus Saccharibacteria bacterium]MBQ6127383.1 hypothetical protein [Candidatus Saccharibacteria bacterium]
MNRLFSYLGRTDKIWRMIWIFIFAGFVAMDAFFPGFFGITFLKLLGIGLCIVYVVQKYYEDRLLQLAFCATFVADLLLAVNNTSLFGVFTFAIAQFIHFARLKKLKKTSFIIIGVLITIFFVCIAAFGKYSIVLMGSVYAFFLITNLLLAREWYKTARDEKKNPAFCAWTGFILFTCCDLCVAGSFFSGLHALPFIFKRAFDFFAWVFYYPSQVLISNSSRITKKVVTDN